MWRHLKIFGTSLAVVVVLGGAGFAGVWFYSANTARTEIETWLEGLERDGYEATVDAIGISGFPRNILVSLDGLSIAADHALDWQWTAPAVQASVSVTNPQRVVVRLRGPQKISYAGTGGIVTMEIRADRLVFQFDLTDDRALEALSINTGGLSLKKAEEDPITAERFQFRATLGQGDEMVPDNTKMSVRFDTLIMPAHTRGPLGDTIQLIQANLELHEPIPNADLGLVLVDWRDADGAVEIEASQVRWGTLDMDGDGGFTLDDQMRPKGWVNAQIRGYATTIDAFDAAGLLDDDERDAIDAVLGFLNQEGRRGNIGLMVRAEDGLIYVGPVSLGKIGPLIPDLAPPD